MDEAGGREREESRIKDRGSWRSNEMEGRCESDCGRDEVYPAIFGNEEKNGLKLDRTVMSNLRPGLGIDTQKSKGIIDISPKS